MDSSVITISTLVPVAHQTLFFRPGRSGADLRLWWWRGPDLFLSPNLIVPSENDKRGSRSGRSVP